MMRTPAWPPNMNEKTPRLLPRNPTEKKKEDMGDPPRGEEEGRHVRDA